MNERRNDLEIVNEYPQIALQTPNSDRSPLYDVRYHARRRPSGLRVRSDVSRTMMSRLEAAHRSSISSGGARRDRTDDLMLAKHALSQLSYGPVPEDECFTLAFAGAMAQQPSFKRPAEPKLQSSEGWWAWEDLNFRPHAYQARALTN
jgi:hypothetical protein